MTNYLDVLENLLGDQITTTEVTDNYFVMSFNYQETAMDLRLSVPDSSGDDEDVNIDSIHLMIEDESPIKLTMDAEEDFSVIKNYVSRTLAPDTNVSECDEPIVERSGNVEKILDFAYEEDVKSAKRLKEVSEWISPSFTNSQELLDLVSSMKEGTGIDFTNSWLNKEFARRKKTTLMMTRIPSMEWNGTTWVPYIYTKEIPWNRMVRFLSQDTDFRYSVTEVVLEDGSKFLARIQKPYLKLDGFPIAYVDFVDDNDDPDKLEQHVAHEICKEIILLNVKINGIEYEYVMSSASQLRTLKGVFIRTDYELPQWFLDGFDRPLYVEFLRSLRGAEAMLEAMTYGAFSTKFSNKFASWLMDAKGLSRAEVESFFPFIAIDSVEVGLAKFLSRVGMSLTSSIPFGNDWRVKRMGSVKFRNNGVLETMLRSQTFIDDEGDLVKRYTDAEINDILKNWKEDKLDGQSAIRASKAIEVYKEMYDMIVTKEEIVGKLFQLRWAGVKGTGLIMADEVLDACQTPDGEYIYKDIDLIVEDNSWKYSPVLELYKGANAPEFELVAISKAKFTSLFNYQFLNGLDGNPNDPDLTYDVFKEIIDENFEVFEEAIVDPAVFKAKIGTVDSGNESVLESFGIDEFEMTIKSKLGQIVNVVEEAVFDPYVRKKFLEGFRKTKEQIELGKIAVEGANRYIISDPIALLRTDLAVKNKEGLWDIIIDDPSQVGLQKPNYSYWANKDAECVLFRSPSIHPGEPQRQDLISSDLIPETIETKYGSIPAREIYEGIKDIVVLNGFSNTLESLGGADTDGDTVLCVTDQRVVNLRNYYRSTVFADVDGDTVNNVVSMKTIKENMVESLKSNGIGLITNYATTWRDIQHVAAKCIATNKRMPETIAKGLYNCVCRAKENLKLNQEWVALDPSIEVIANMINDEKDPEEKRSTYDPVVVYEVADVALEQLRALQEMSINTAKSGIFVEFGTKNPDKNNYNHLGLKIRASWHKPKHDEEYRYTSTSPLGQLNVYAKDKWQELLETSRKTSRSLFPGIDKSFDTDLIKVAEYVEKLRISYGKTVNPLSIEYNSGKITEEQFGEAFQVLCEDMHAELTCLSMEHGTDMIAIMAYDASYKDAQRNGKGASFVWNCFFDEFLHTVKLSRQEEERPANERVFPISVNPLLVYEKLHSGEITVREKQVIQEGIIIGSTGLEDGDYNMVVVDNRPYITKLVEMKTVDELTESLRDVVFRLVGFKYNNDLVSKDGELLDKDKLVEYLTNDIGQNIIRVKPEKLDRFSKSPRIGFYIRIGDREDGEPLWMPIGSVEDKGFRILSRALSQKILRVKLHPEYKTEPKTRLSLVIEEVLMDELV